MMRAVLSDRIRLTNAMAISILLHALVVALVPLLRNVRVALPAPAAVEVDLVRLPPPARPAAPVVPPQPAAAPPILLPETQFVDPSDAGEEVPPAATRLLSDRDARVEKEQVRRGDSGEQETAKAPEQMRRGAVAKEQAESVAPGEAARRAEPPQVAALPRLDKLLPTVGDVIEQSAPAAKAEPKTPPARDFLTGGGGRTFLLQPGTRDFLPYIREGDITLLNTKAHAFAPFARRVAKRVFDHLVIALRHAVDSPGVFSGREAAQVEAIMDREGNFVRARLVERQGSTGLSLDRMLLSAARPDVFFDANPPPGVAAEDGHIHFLLTIDLSVFGSASRQGSGRPALFGYQGVAGVGLR